MGSINWRSYSAPDTFRVAIPLKIAIFFNDSQKLPILKTCDTVNVPGFEEIDKNLRYPIVSRSFISLFNPVNNGP